MYLSEPVPLKCLFCKETTSTGLLFQETSFQLKNFVLSTCHLRKKKAQKQDRIARHDTILGAGRDPR